MWFKQFNHLYTDYSFDMAIIEEFERQIMEAVNMEKDESNVEANDERSLLCLFPSSGQGEDRNDPI